MFTKLVHFACRVSRTVAADPLIQELNVGDASEPEGRGTGQPSLNQKQMTLDNIFSSVFLFKCQNLIWIYVTSVTSLFGPCLHTHSHEINTIVKLLWRSVQWNLSDCFGQVALWQTWTGTDSWTCCWPMVRAPGNQSLSSRSHRCVGHVCLSQVKEVLKSFH